jgi:branched-chain amino acid transport system ATP-binding protein
VLLDVQNISISFKGLRALQDVSFSVRQGEIVALIGPNGAGKTTLFNIIAGALPAKQGRIDFSASRLTPHTPEIACARGITRTFQTVRPFLHMTVLENVMVGALHRTTSPHKAREKALALLRRFNFASAASANAASLSLPDRKLLELVRALATEPKLLLLDEVMAGLRPTECNQIVDVLRESNREGLTILLVEHVMRVVMSLAQRIIVLHHGVKIAEGLPAEISQNSDVIENYFGRGRPAA